MLGMKNHFDISGSIEIREVDIAGVACICISLFIIVIEAFGIISDICIFDSQKVTIFSKIFFKATVKMVLVL